MRAARMATRSSLATLNRPKLADVTNLPAPPPRNENLPEFSDKDRVEQLTRERLALIKLVTERNRTIELSGAELQKLRVSVQKLQLQNWNLARSNSQMLAELNSRRDTVKTLQHELLCKEALLKAKNIDTQGKSEMKCQNAGSKLKEAEETTLHEVDNDDKPRIGNKRRATRSQSLGASTKCQKVSQSLTLPGKAEMKCQTAGHQLMEGEKPALQEASKDEKDLGNIILTFNSRTGMMVTVPGKEEMKCQTAGHQLMEGEKPALQEASKDEKDLGNIILTINSRTGMMVTVPGKEEMKCQTAGHQLMEGEKPALQEASKDEKDVGNTILTFNSRTGMMVTVPGKEEMKCQTAGHQLMEGEKPALQEASKDEKPCVGNKRRATRSAMGASTTCQNIEQEEKVENKRRSLRRQSSRFKSHEEEHTENLFEIEEAKFPENSMLENVPIPFISPTKQEEKEDSCAAKSEGVSLRSSIGRPLPKAVKKDTKFPENLISNGDPPTTLVLSTNKEKEEITAPKNEAIPQRCSIGRPLRKAVEKVHSYKELPLKVKMRRTE